MTRVIVELSMSLDGYVTGPDVSVEEPMGRGGEQLHDWMFEGRSEEELEKFQRNHFGGVGATGAHGGPAGGRAASDRAWSSRCFISPPKTKL